MQQKKNILITGAATGIGKDTAKALMSRGHSVFATTHSDEQTDTLKRELGPSATVFKLDVTNAVDRKQVADLHLDVLINNAGQGQSGSLAEIDVDKIRQLFEVNLFSSLELSQIAIRNMISRGGGTVIFISSITGRIPAPFFMPYSMTKFAVSAGAAGLREEMKVLNKGIQISVVEPGPYATGYNQSMSDSRFEWMKDESLYSDEQIAKLKKKSDKELLSVESKSTKTIVKQIVKASEAKKPRLRYVAPLPFAIIVRVMRIFGV